MIGASLVTLTTDSRQYFLFTDSKCVWLNFCSNTVQCSLNYPPSTLITFVAPFMRLQQVHFSCVYSCDVYLEETAWRLYEFFNCITMSNKVGSTCRRILVNCHAEHLLCSWVWTYGLLSFIQTTGLSQTLLLSFMQRCAWKKWFNLVHNTQR